MLLRFVSVSRNPSLTRRVVIEGIYFGIGLKAATNTQESTAAFSYLTPLAVTRLSQKASLGSRPRPIVNHFTLDTHLNLSAIFHKDL